MRRFIAVTSHVDADLQASGSSSSAAQPADPPETERFRAQGLAPCDTAGDSPTLDSAANVERWLEQGLSAEFQEVAAALQEDVRLLRHGGQKELKKACGKHGVVQRNKTMLQLREDLEAAVIAAAKALQDRVRLTSQDSGSVGQPALEVAVASKKRSADAAASAAVLPPAAKAKPSARKRPGTSFDAAAQPAAAKAKAERRAVASQQLDSEEGSSGAAQPADCTAATARPSAAKAKAKIGKQATEQQPTGSEKSSGGTAKSADRAASTARPASAKSKASKKSTEKQQAPYAESQGTAAQPADTAVSTPRSASAKAKAGKKPVEKQHAPSEKSQDSAAQPANTLQAFFAAAVANASIGSGGSSISAAQPAQLEEAARLRPRSAPFLSWCSERGPSLSSYSGERGC
jgi:hypothetical protein